MDLGLAGKVALVAAASQGLGKAVALSLASEGARVAICARNRKLLLDAAEQIERKTKSIVFPVQCDVSDPSETPVMIDSVLQQFGTVHILVNNAGGPPVNSFEELSDEDWQKGIQLNLMSVVRLSRTVIPHMQKQKWGRIINITSISGKQPIPELVISSALRPGILGLTKVLATRYANDGILVNSVCPGYIMTDKQREQIHTRAVKAGQDAAEYLQEHVKEIPLGRYGTPQELGDLVAFLASERASYITGSNFGVDGGMYKGLM